MRQTQIRIGDEWWVLRIGDPGPDRLGLCEHDDKIITLRQGLGHEQAEEVLFHEVTHAVSPWLDEDHVSKTGLALSNAKTAYENLSHPAF